MFRLGRTIDVMYSALSTIHLPDKTLRLTLTMSRITSSIYLLTDHIIWLSKIGLVNVDSHKWSTTSNKYWLYSITWNLIRDLYEIQHILNNSSHCFVYRRPDQDFRSNQLPTEVLTFLLWIRKNKSVSVDTLKNVCDLLIPLNNLGYLKYSPITIGCLGMVSSFLSMLQIYDFTYRLTPSWINLIVPTLKRIYY